MGERVGKRGGGKGKNKEEKREEVKERRRKVGGKEEERVVRGRRYPQRAHPSCLCPLAGPHLQHSANTWVVCFTIEEFLGSFYV